MMGFLGKTAGATGPAASLHQRAAEKNRAEAGGVGEATRGEHGAD